MQLKKYISMEIEQGEMIPRFYLPVIRPFDRYAYEVWIFPLAFLVVFYQIFSSAFRLIWRDTIDWIRDMNEIYKLKNK